MSGSWKVAYADFVTAMMAFFLLMWILNMAPKETLDGLAEIFSSDASARTSAISPISDSGQRMRVDKLSTTEVKVSEDERSQLAIVQEIKAALQADAIPSGSSGVSSTSVGVLLHVTGDVMFNPGSVDISEEGQRVLNEVIRVMDKYKVFVVVRGHSAQGETGAPVFPSKWELSSARATAAARYIMDKGGISPNLIRTVAYADTRPLVPDTDPNASAKNRRVEFYFHRPEVMTSLGGY